VRNWEDWGEGDGAYRIINIPNEYFHMNKEEIVEKHTKWSREKVLNLIQMYKDRERADKLEKLNKLKEELGQ
jgi:hypothetical protein